VPNSQVNIAKLGPESTEAVAGIQFDRGVGLVPCVREACLLLRKLPV
jgi:hypothetical protein